MVVRFLRKRTKYSYTENIMPSTESITGGIPKRIVRIENRNTNTTTSQKENVI